MNDKNNIKWKDLKPGTLLRMKCENEFHLRASAETEIRSVGINKGEIILFLKLVEIRLSGSGLYSFIFGDRIVYSVFPPDDYVNIYDIIG